MCLDRRFFRYQFAYLGWDDCYSQMISSYRCSGINYYGLGQFQALIYLFIRLSQIIKRQQQQQQHSPKPTLDPCFKQQYAYLFQFDSLYFGSQVPQPYNEICHALQYSNKMCEVRGISLNFPQQLSVQTLTLIQQTLQIYNNLLLKEQSSKIQLDGTEGQQAFRLYMTHIEKLLKLTNSNISDRNYRSAYTNAYKILYQDGSLGYIPEIYDSAQQGIPFIYVNGDRYDFSTEVLILGQQLVQAYYRLIHELRITTLKVTQQHAEESQPPKHETVNFYKIVTCLQGFDLSWTKYEQRYITELICIQNHSKAAIKTIIKAEEELNQYETKQKLMGKIFISGEQFDNLRRKLCEHISRLNSIANIDGKGRDDLTFEVLASAENVLNTVTEFQSKSVRILAEKIRESFENVREVLRFFSQSFDMVDPQLKNNPELVAALQQYECYWQKGKRYFIEPKKQNQIVAFSTIVQAAKEKYPNFCELIDYSDPSIFWIIPSLIVLRSLQGEDEGLAQSFLISAKPNQPLSQKQMQLSRLKHRYEQMKKQKKGQYIYNHLQEMLIGLRVKNPQEQQLFLLATKIKQVAVNLQRVSPMDWNDMLGVLLLEG